jgi:hypothetical protein
MVMAGDSDAIRAELARQILAIGLKAERGAARDIARDVDAVRSLAYRHGLMPAATVAHALETALARGGSGVMVRGWLDVLRDAVGCERNDAHACESYVAACSVRYH